MEHQSQVLTTEVEFEGQIHSASYYVENDIIHANIGGRFMSVPLNGPSAKSAVQTLLRGHLLQTQRSARQRSHWSAN